ncbi:MAG: hypothetical protein AB9856_08090 [Cellulosilyticaceae bacterium]
MPTISKIRFVNVVYEKGNKRYNDSTFLYDGHNGVIVLENGAGKTVYIQAALQAILPHVEIGKRKVKNTFSLEGEALHVAIEWIISDKPKRHYAVTAATLYLQDGELKSYKYVYEYGSSDDHGIENIPFTYQNPDQTQRAASKGEIWDYYQQMNRNVMVAKAFQVTKDFHEYIEEHFKIIPEEWHSIASINGEEGGIEAYFNGCNTTVQLVEKLLIPSIEQATNEKGKVNFAETFESHRENVKKYQELKKVIEESKKVKNKMSFYVENMTMLHENEKAHYHDLAYAKGMGLLIENKCSELETKLSEAIEAEKRCEKELKKLEQEKALCQLTDLNIQLQKQGEELAEATEKFMLCNNLYKNKRLEHTKLKIAKKQMAVEQVAGEIRGLQKELTVLNEDISIQELYDDLEENGGELHCLYADLLEQYDKKRNVFLHQKERKEEEHETIDIKKQALEKTIKDKETERIKLETLIEEAIKKLKQIEKILVGNEESINITEQKQEWEKQIAKNEETFVKIEEGIRKARKDKAGIDENNLYLQNEITRLEKQESEESTKQENIENQETRIVNSIKERMVSLYAIDRIYTKKEQIIGTIFDKLQYLEQQKEEYLVEERKLSRFLDFYKGHRYFMPEPLLETFIEKWQNQFEYLISGGAYVETLCNTETYRVEDCYAKYPGWVETVITTDKELDKLKERLIKYNEELTYPVTILSLTEVSRIIRGEVIATNKVYPLSWQQYLEPETFQEKLAEGEKKVAEIKRLRKEKEDEIKDLTSLINKIQDFLKTYSYEDYKGICERLEQVKVSLQSEKQSLEKNQIRKQEIEVLLQASQEDKQQLQEQLNYLNDRVYHAYEYLKIEQEKTHYHEQYQGVKQVLEKNNYQLNQIIKELVQIKAIIGDYAQEIEDLQDKKRDIERDEIYKEVKTVGIKPTKELLSVLKEERESLKKSLNQQQASRSSLQQGIKQKNMQKESLETEIEQERRFGNYYEVVTLNYDQVEELKFEGLIKEIPKIKEERDALDKQVDKLRSSYDHNQGIYTNEKTKYEENYEPVMAFIENTQIKRDEIGKKESQIKHNQSQTLVYKKKLIEQNQLWQNQKSLIERKDERYKYLADKVKALQLTESEILEIQYAIEKKVQEMVRQLEVSLQTYEKQKEKVNHERERFIYFCNTEIKDAKLRTLAHQGIEVEKNYDQTLEWQRNLNNRIGVTIRYQEDAMRQHDKDINQFIIHLYTHLTTIATELGQIHKKTKLKTENGTQYFYDIKVPEWKEEESKIKLRDYINEVSQMIERKYENEILDKQAHEEIKKFIATKFKVTQLVNVLIGTDKIKVKCRKAISVGNISAKMFSWEESNEWSGGEKWSKNMALFLGILNYIAEKKQNTYTAEKVSRVVILDNPFGKASSDHVLEPVFFIAQQLGFQIIALTAHGEGDFIRKYFPIVYSCKLRKAKDESTTLVTAKQEINKAYFREVSPFTLMRLGQIEQLDLF